MERFCIDASVFLGMNSNDEIIRVSCKNFFIENQNAEILMNFEQIGFCDDVIWSFPFKLQSIYYPFMDMFHSVMPIKRMPYSTYSIDNISSDEEFPIIYKLNIAFAKEHNATIYSLNSVLYQQANAKEISIGKNEKSFNEELEKYYQESLILRIDVGNIFQYVE